MSDVDHDRHAPRAALPPVEVHPVGATPLVPPGATAAVTAPAEPAKPAEASPVAEVVDVVDVVEPPAEPPAPSAWNLANLLTVVRILLVPVFGWLLLAHDGGQTAYRMGAFVVFAVAAITDLVDGDLARRRNSVTDFGKVTDPIADKALTGMALIGLSVIDELPWWVTTVFLAREVGVTVMRFVVIRHGVMPASRGGKVKTVLQAFALAMLVFPPDVLPFALAWSMTAHLVLWVALAVTVATGVDYAAKAHVLRRTSARAVAKRAARAPSRRQ